MKEVNFDRFYIEEEQFEKYKEIEDSDKFIFQNHPDIFILSAIIGYKISSRKKIQNKYQLTLKNSVLNSEIGKLTYNSFFVITEKIGEIDEDNNLKVNNVIEEYANAGFDFLYDNILSKNKPTANNKKYLNYILLNLEQ